MSWREGWDLDMRRFAIRKYSDDNCEGGEQWQVVDFHRMQPMALSASKTHASMIADALEYLSCHANADQFEQAIDHA